MEAKGTDRMAQGEIQLVLDDWIPMPQHTIIPSYVTPGAWQELMMDVCAFENTQRPVRIDEPKVDVCFVQIVFVFLVKTSDFQKRASAKRCICPLQLRKVRSEREAHTVDRPRPVLLRAAQSVSGGEAV